MKLYVFLLLTILTSVIFSSCKGTDDRFDEFEYISISNIQLQDIGKDLPPTESLFIHREDNTIFFEIITHNIKIGDSIEDLRVRKNSHSLEIILHTTPYSFDCNDASCFSNFSLKFDLDATETNGPFNITPIINGVYGTTMNYKL